MPVWPVLMAVAAGLTLAGVRLGAWVAPALILLGYLAMRGIRWGLTPDVHELAACTLWLCISTALMYKGAWVPGFFLTLSALTYPMFLIFGVRLEYFGLSAIAADLFGILALLAVGGGLAGLAGAGSDRDGVVGRFPAHSLGVAPR